MNSPEDQTLMKQWQNFKTVIEKNPVDFESMHNYINGMSEEDTKDQKSARNVYSPVSPTARPSAKVELNYAKLKKLSGDFVSTINRNNREMFKV